MRLFAKAQPASLWICPKRVTAWLEVLTRCRLLASLEIARSLPRISQKRTNKNADHAHAWLCCCSWKGLRPREFVAVVPLALHRHAHTLGILPCTKSIFREDRFVLPSQMEVFMASMTPMVHLVALSSTRTCSLLCSPVPFATALQLRIVWVVSVWYGDELLLGVRQNCNNTTI